MSLTAANVFLIGGVLGAVAVAVIISRRPAAEFENPNDRFALFPTGILF